jgi:hypothetical protein
MVAPPIDQTGDRRAGWITVIMPRSIAHFSSDWGGYDATFSPASVSDGWRSHLMDNPHALAQQYWRYGKAQHWRMMHRIRPKLRQLAAAHLATHVCWWSLALAPLWWGLAVPPLAYIALVCLVPSLRSSAVISAYCSQARLQLSCT